MGWGGGTYAMHDIIAIFKQVKVETPKRVEIYRGVIKAFKALDWDQDDECVGYDEAFDTALVLVRREWCEKNGYDYDDFYGDRS